MESMRAPEWLKDETLRHRLRRVLLLLGGILLLVILLFGCGQVALWDPIPRAYTDTRSKLAADYQPWPYLALAAIDPAVVEEIQHDLANDPDAANKILPVIGGQIQFWPTPEPEVIANVSPTSTHTAAAVLTSTPTESAATPTPTATTQTPPPTPTGTPATASTPTGTSTLTLIGTPTRTRTLPPSTTYTPTRTNAPTLTPTYTATFAPTGTYTPTNTAVVPLTNTDTPVPTSAPTNTSAPTAAPTDTPTVTPTPTDTPTPTPTDTPTITSTPTDTPTSTVTYTPTVTFTPTITPTPTSTSTSTPTPTNTPAPCTGNPAGINIGPPDSSIWTIGCGQSVIIDLVAMGGSAINTTTQDVGTFDFVQYEWAVGANIMMDWVITEVGTGPSGSCATSTWYTILNWGDGSVSNNGIIGGAYPENDNEVIPQSALYLGSTTGIAIDIDDPALSVPAGIYYCVRFSAPLGGGNDPGEVDSIEILP